MSRIHLLFAAAIVVVLIRTRVDLAIDQENSRPPDGFTALFNGRDINNWSVATKRDLRKTAAVTPQDRTPSSTELKKGIADDWHVEGGVLFGDGGPSILATREGFSDFELWIDWKIGARGDGGIYLRDTAAIRFCQAAPGAQRAESANKGSGKLSGDERPDPFPFQLAGTPNETWNRMYVRMVGPLLTVRLNDKEVIHNKVLENEYARKQQIALSGPMYLQTNGPETRFRNIFIRKISAEESAKVLGEIHGGEEGFEPLFNGRDLRNWIGGVDSYQVVDGAIQCRTNKEGVLLTKDSYDNFVVRLEFKLPPGGNNGLAIRAMPSDQDPAYDAFEIQVLDDSAKQYAQLKPYQFHGSLYGLAPATRGYLRPQGEWNYEEVTIDHDRFRVDLNGFEILRVATRELPTMALDGQKHPGVSRASGHFGFCGHDDPVSFRNIRIKRLPLK